MAVYRRPARSRLTLLLLVVTSVTLLTLDYRGGTSGAVAELKDRARDAFAPVQDASDRVFSPIGNLVGGIVNYGDLKVENDRLRRENAELRGAVLRADDAERERQALLDQLDLPFAGDLPRVDARVVSFSPSNFQQTVEIDRGTAAGVARNMPVVTGAGLVGQVKEVSRRRAVVQLLTNRQFSVGVRLTGSGDAGVAEGAGPRRALRVELVDPRTTVSDDEVVVTSGLQQSRFPPGIPVGKVASARARPNSLQQEVTVVPVVDLRRLTFVTVLQWSPASP